MTTCNKRMWKRGEIAPKEQFLLFSTLFYIYISNFKSQITYSFVKYGCSIYCFPHSLNSDMSRYLGVRDNESRLYVQTSIMNSEMGNFRINPDFTFTLVTRHPFVTKVVIWVYYIPEITLKN